MWITGGWGWSQFQRQLKKARASLFILVDCLGMSGWGRAGSCSRAPACSPGCTGSMAAAAQRTCVGARVGNETEKIVGTGGHRIKEIAVRVGANTGKNGSAPACSPGCRGSTAAAAQSTCVSAGVGTEDRENSRQRKL